MTNYHNLWVFEITNQLLTHHLLYLVPGMNGDVNKVDFLLVSCLYNKQNNTWLLGNMEYLFKCSTSYLTFLLHSLVRYQVEHSKGKSISLSTCILFFTCCGLFTNTTTAAKENRISFSQVWYLRVILRGRTGYELIYITNEAVGRVAYYRLISGKSEKNNCFSKFSSNSLDFFGWNFLKLWHFLYRRRREKIFSDLQNFSTRNFAISFSLFGQT